MAIIKPEQLSSGSYNISGSFSGSFQGDGSGLDNVTASLAPNYTLTSSFNTFTSSYIQDSSSFDTRILNNSSSIDLLSGSFDSFTQTYNTGSFTGSFIGDGSQLTGIISSKWSGSNPISRESDVDVSGSFRVSGSIDVTKQLTAQTVAINTSGPYTATLISNTLTTSRNFYFPDKQGTLALREDLPNAGSGLTQLAVTPDVFKLGGIVTENTTLVDDSNTYNLSLNGPNLYLYKADDNSAPTIRLNRASGSASTPLPPPAFGYLGVISAGGYDSGVLPGSAALIFQASENFTTSSRGTDLFFNTTPNGTNIPIRRLTIYNDGTVNISGSLIVTGSINSPSITGSLFGTASWAVNAQTASYVLPLNQDVLISGSLKFDPTQDPDPSGLDLDSTSLFQSSSNTALGYDLYIRQNGNLVKWKWVEGIMNTGLLYGGIVSYSGTNVFVSPGSGIIVDHNATTGSEISPIVEYVTWPAITQSITNIATQQVTYLYIDNAGALQQQSSRFTNEQYHDYIPLGAVGHFDYTQVSAFGGQVQTAYDQVAQISGFVDAFGPLKVSGYGITGQPGTLRLSVGSGISFIHGGFYENDPELPSQITTPAQATASMAYVYRSGSGVRFDTNGGNLYTQLKPGFYDPGTGVTGSVSNNDWTIQRVYSDPKTGILYVYFGQNIYPDFLTAVADLSTDSFTEGDTFDFTTFIGFLVLKSNGTNITAADNKIVPAGLFRGSGQGSGGGVAISNLDDLTDVSITGPTNGEALIYDSGIWQNGVPLNATSASFASSGNGSFSGSFSGSYVGDGSGLTGVGAFPFTGSALITGSLAVTGSASILAYTASADSIFNIRNNANTANMFSSLGSSQFIFGTSTTSPEGLALLRHDFGSAQPILTLRNGQYGNLIFQVRDERTANTGTIGSFRINGIINGGESGTTKRFDLGGHGLGATYGDNSSNAVWLNDQGNVGDGAGSSVISVSSNFYLNLQTTKKIKFEGVSGHFGIGNVGTLGARLDVKAQGALSTDIAFRVRNSADSDNIISVKGNNSIFLLGETSNARLELTKVGNTITLLKQRVTSQFAPRFVIASYADGGDSGQVQLDALFGDGSTVGFTTQRLISGVTDLVGNSLYGAFGGANATVFVMKNSIGYAGYGTIPSALPVNHFGMYSADITAGNASPHFRTENGSIIKLYQQSAVTSSQGLADVLTNVGLLSGSSIISSTVPSGPFGIADTSGSYTYYTTFSASIAAATSGQTVEMFADIIETGSVTVTLKNGVNINGNGHTYTLNNSGLTHALTVPVTVETSCNILNLNVIRTGSTGSLADNSALVLGTNGTGTINCNGSTFRNLVSGSGILFNTNSGHEINYAVAYAKTTWGAIAMFTSFGARLNNSIGYGTSGGFGIRCHNGGDIQNCIGTSDSGYGIYGLAGNQSNSVGISATGNGFFAAATAFNCVGRSTSGIGFEAQNGTNIVGCVGISTSGRGLATQNATTHNCTGISSSSSGVSLGGNGKSYNITAKSSTSYALWGTVTTQQLYGGTIVCSWNNAAGYGIRGNGGTILSAIVNCTFNLSNASAPYLFNDNVAQAITMRGNTYQGGAVFNANLTQATVATQDNQGNIFL